MLEQIGLTRGESKVYLALLNTGETTTGPIIKKAQITGSKVYDILERLSRKGLVACVVKNGTKYFYAAPPGKLVEYVEKEEQALRERKKLLEELVPKLESQLKINEKSQSVYLFEGFRGIKTVFDMILENVEPGKEYLAFTLGEELKDKDVMLFLKSYHKKRIRRKISVRIIANLKEKSLFKELSKLKYLKIKYIDNSVPTGVFVFGDYVATFTFVEKPLAFVIKSEKVASYYRNFFEYMWKK
jgi:sugar-specific transcriptional regulator TrmB